MKRLFLMLILACTAMLTATAAWAAKPMTQKNVTERGTILTEPGNYKLVNDLLECPGNGVEITGSDITLNMHGYEIACADNDLEVGGVIVYSTSEAMVRNVTIKNGYVSNCRDGIVLIQTEDSKVILGQRGFSSF